MHATKTKRGGTKRGERREGAAGVGGGTRKLVGCSPIAMPLVHAGLLGLMVLRRLSFVSRPLRSMRVAVSTVLAVAVIRLQKTHTTHTHAVTAAHTQT